MIGINGIEMPRECWECDLAYDNCNGYTMCSVTGQILYPRGTRDTRPDDCPLREIKLGRGKSMWKIIFKYPDGGTVKLTNSKQPMNERLARKYYEQYRILSDGGIYQKYPKKKYRPIALATVVDILAAGSDLESEILIEQEN